MTDMSAAEYRTQLRRDPEAFSHRAFLLLHPGRDFKPNWHHRVVAAYLEKCRIGKCRRLIISGPPRTLKSMQASVAFPAFVLGRNPTRQFLCVSHTQKLAARHGQDCLNIMSADFYPKVFTDTVLSRRRPAVADFKTTQNGFRKAISVGSAITGFGADFIIIDDPLSADHAMSEVKREGVNEWFADNIFGRLNDPQTGCIIVVAQRLHVNDLIGYLQRQTHEHWEVLSFPAIAEVAETFRCDTPYGPFTHHRAVGDVLDPAWMSRELLEERKAALGADAFAAQYQQNPNPAGAVIIKDSYFGRYRDYELPQKFDRVVQSWDTANTPGGNSSSYSCCTTWGQKGNRIYLIHVWRERVAYQDLKSAVQQLRDRYRPQVILVEDRASGIQLVQELRAAGIDRIEPCQSSESKTVRVVAQLPLIESGQIFLPEQVVWLSDYLDEVRAFPNSPHTDQLNSTAQALGWFNQHPPVLAWIEQWNDFERLKQESDTVLMRAPPDCTTYSDIKGRQINLGPDRLVRVDKMSVPFLPLGWKRA